MSFGSSCIKKEVLHPQHGQHGWISQRCGPRESGSIVQMGVCLNEQLRSELTKLRPTGRFPKKSHCSDRATCVVALVLIWRRFSSFLRGRPCMFSYRFPFVSDENRFDPDSDQRRRTDCLHRPGKHSPALSPSQKKVAFNLKYTKKPKGFFLLKSIWKQWEVPARRVCHFVPPSLTSFVCGN